MNQSILTDPTDARLLAPELLSQFPAVAFASTPVVAIQIPIACDNGTTRTLIVCPHVVAELIRLEANLSAAQSTLAWMLNPATRDRFMESGSYHRPEDAPKRIDRLYLENLTDHTNDDGCYISFKAEDAASNLLHALGTIIGDMKGGRLDRWDWQILGLPEEVHAYEDASCCPARHALYLAVVAKLDQESAT